jgi:hypothetical protein
VGNKSGVLLYASVVLATCLSTGLGYADDSSEAPVKPANDQAQENTPTAAPAADTIRTSAAAPSTVTATPQSVTNAQASSSPAWYSKFGLRWDGVFYGPGVTDVNTYQPDLYNKSSLGQPDQGSIFVRNAIGTTYAIGNGWFVGATLRADVYPSEVNRDYFIDDSYVRIMNPKLVNRGNFNMSGDLRFYLPTSQGSRTVGQSISVVTQFIPSYSFENSRWSVGAIMRQQSYTHYSWVNSSAMDTDAYFGPNVNYQISPTVSVGVLYEMEAVHYQGTAAFAFTTQNYSNPGLMTPTDIEPNLSWDITPRVNFNPFLNLYPGGKFNLETTSVGFFFGAKLI